LAAEVVHCHAVPVLVGELEELELLGAELELLGGVDDEDRVGLVDVELLAGVLDDAGAELELLAGGDEEDAGGVDDWQCLLCGLHGLGVGGLAELISATLTSPSSRTTPSSIAQIRREDHREGSACRGMGDSPSQFVVRTRR
jgi:hypothetical protein